jgi:hypothetical protein
MSIFINAVPFPLKPFVNYLTEEVDILKARITELETERGARITELEVRITGLETERDNLLDTAATVDGPSCDINSESDDWSCSESSSEALSPVQASRTHTTPTYDNRKSWRGDIHKPGMPPTPSCSKGQIQGQEDVEARNMSLYGNPFGLSGPRSRGTEEHHDRLSGHTVREPVEQGVSETNRCHAIKANGKRCRQNGKKSGGPLIMGVCKYHSKKG